MPTLRSSTTTENTSEGSDACDNSSEMRGKKATIAAAIPRTTETPTAPLRSGGHHFLGCSWGATSAASFGLPLWCPPLGFFLGATACSSLEKVLDYPQGEAPVLSASGCAMQRAFASRRNPGRRARPTSGRACRARERSTDGTSESAGARKIRRV